MGESRSAVPYLQRLKGKERSAPGTGLDVYSYPEGVTQVITSWAMLAHVLMIEMTNFTHLHLFPISSLTQQFAITTSSPHSKPLADTSSATQIRIRLVLSYNNQLILAPLDDPVDLQIILLRPFLRQALEQAVGRRRVVA